MSAETEAGEPHDDDALLSALCAGDAQALESIFQRYGALVFRLASRSHERESDARDVVQSVFLRLWERPPPADLPGSRLRRWISTTALNVIRETRRARRRLGVLDPDVVASTEPAFGSRRDLERAIRALPDRQREVVLLRLVEDRSVADTAEVLGCAEGTVKVHLHRALIALRKGLGECT